MATSNATTKCHTCREETTTYICTGCSKHFCVDDLRKHREELQLQFHDIEDQRNQFAQTLGDHRNNTNNHPLFIQITQWEKTSIEKIQKTAKEQRQILQKPIRDHTQKIETKLGALTEEMQTIAKKKDFNEMGLRKLQTQLNNLKKELDQPAHIQIKEDSSTTYISKLSITINTTPEQTSFFCDKKLDCDGHACPKCGCCRDWYWRPDGDKKNYKKRADATCTYDHISPLSGLHIDASPRGYASGLASARGYASGLYLDYFHGRGHAFNRLCECEDNQS